MAMADGKRKDEWDRASALLAFIAEPNRNRQKHPEPFVPADFNPMVKRKRTTISVSELAASIGAKQEWQATPKTSEPVAPPSS